MKNPGSTSTGVTAGDSVYARGALLHVPQPLPADPSTSAWWMFHLTAGTFGRLGVPFYFAAAGFFLARHFG